MKTIWKLFVGDIRRITSNVVSIIIVIGLVVIPGIFTWFNVAASWDPFANTGNLKFAVANEDDGYRSDLIPVKINIGDQVVTRCVPTISSTGPSPPKKKPSTAPNPANITQLW